MSNFFIQKERWIWREENLEATCIISCWIFLHKQQGNTERAELELEKNKTETHKLLPFQSVSKLFSLLANTEIGGVSFELKLFPEITFPLIYFLLFAIGKKH